MFTMKKTAIVLALILLLGLLLPMGNLLATAGAKADVSLRLYNVWATWCPPCVAEIPALGQISRDYQGRVEVIGLQLDAIYNDWSPNQQAIEAAKSLFAKSNATYTNLVPDLSHYDLLTASGAIPASYFMDSKGQIIKEVIGSRDYAGWSAIIDELLALLSTQPLPGDATNDGTIDILDLVSIIDWIVSNTSPASPANADANGDKTIDILDLVWVIDQIVGG